MDGSWCVGLLEKIPNDCFEGSFLDMEKVGGRKRERERTKKYNSANRVIMIVQYDTES